MNPNIWTNKRVLVTGHTGFKGSWLCLWLRQLGAEVCGLALSPPTDPSLFEQVGLASQITSIQGDVCDLSIVRDAMDRFKPELVMHLAAQSLVQPSYDQPVQTYATNVMGTVCVLEAARHTPSVRAALVVTSDKCYENREWAWPYRETEPLGGYDPYSSSKGCAELVAAAYRQSFFKTRGVALATARAGNVIGGGDWACARLIPDLVKAWSQNESVCLRHPDAVRPWQHVLDALHGYLTLCEQLLSQGHAFAEAWNFGPWDRDVRSVAEVVSIFSDQWKGACPWNQATQPGVHEAQALKLDSSKARQKLKWKPVLELDDALRWTAQWYQAWHDGAESQKLCVEQIQLFQEQAVLCR